MRRLLAEGEEWLAAEHDRGSERARAAFEDLRVRLDPAGKERSGIAFKTLLLNGKL